MRVSELQNRYRRRKRDPEELGSLAPLADGYDIVLADLRRLDGVDGGPSTEAAERLGVEPRIVAKGRQGVTPSAHKTGENGDWEWCIPPDDLDAGPTEDQDPTTSRVISQRKREREL